MDHQHQLAQGQLLGHVVGTVQTVPLTLCMVAALVAVAVSVMVLAVLVIERAEGRRRRSLGAFGPGGGQTTDNSHVDSLALSLQVLAVESIEETSSVVALRVALSVAEVAPALQRRRAVLPRVVEVQGAVPVVPAARVIVAHHVTDLVVLTLLALRDLAGHLHRRRRLDVYPVASPEVRVQDVAAEAVEAAGADAVVVRSLGRRFARAAVVAGVGVTQAVGGILALRPVE